MISEVPTRRPLLYAALLKGPEKYADKARHGDLTVQKKKKQLIKIFPAVKKNTCKHLLRVIGDPLSLPVMSSQCPTILSLDHLSSVDVSLPSSLPNLNSDTAFETGVV